MNWKIYLASVSLLCAFLCCPIESKGCGGESYNPYGISVFFEGIPLNTNSEDKPGYEETLDFWENYTNGVVSRQDIRKFFDNVSYKNTGDATKYNFYQYLVNKNDREALEYIAYCLELGELVDEYQGNLWDYDTPSVDGFYNFIDRIEKVKTSKTFKPRYDFLKIRAYGGAKDNEGVMKIWNKSGKKLQPSPLKTRMEGYVGGVLYREGNYVDALDYFAKTGDQNSILWCIEKLAGTDNLTQLYDHDPNSVAIPYIINDYINYLISYTDAGRKFNNTTFKRPDDYYFEPMTSDEIADLRNQISQMSGLCKRVLSEGKTENPKMWTNALGVLQIIAGNENIGLETLKDAENLKDNEQSENNRRNLTLWALLLNSGKGNSNLDSEFANALVSFYKKVYNEAKSVSKDYSKTARENRENYISQATANYKFLYDFMNAEATSHYISIRQPERAMAFEALVASLPDLKYYNYDLETFRYNLDKGINLDDVKKFLAYAETNEDSSHINQNPVDKVLKPYAAANVNLINDIIGTRLMREGKFKQALPYLTEVDTKWIKTQPISPYLNRWFSSGEYYDFRRHTTRGNPEHFYVNNNQKAEICSKFIEEIEEYNNLTGDAKARKALDLAALSHFASPLGDGWAISEYTWSSVVPKNEFTLMAQSWLGKAKAAATDAKTKALVNYALLAMPTGSEFDKIAIGNTSTSNGLKYFIYSPTGEQKEALRSLANGFNTISDLPYHITSCDVLKSYVGGRFISKPNYY